jgi:hypothetical protein
MKNPLEKIRVRNCDSVSSYGTVRNQFIITVHTKKGRKQIFQSYNSTIAVIDENHQVWLDKYKWDYSTTTGKYRNQFLGENIAETRKKIKSGEYKLADLN